MSDQNPSPSGQGGTPPATTIPLSVEEYQRLRSLERQLEELQLAQQEALEDKEAERLRALAEKGQVEDALAQQRKAWESKHAEALSRHRSPPGPVRRRVRASP